MPYESLGGVKGSFIDGALKTPRTTNQPRILVVGPADSGTTNDLFFVTNTAVAEREFGAETSVLRGVHELLAQGATNIAIMRSGGSPGSLVLEDTDGNQITFTPASFDDEILSRYALIVENDGTSNRYLVYDLTEEEFVYDTSEIEVINGDSMQVEGEGDIVDLWELNDRTDPTAAIDMATMVSGDITTDGDPVVLTQSEGTDGTNPSLVERYAALNTTYHGLDYKDADFLLPKDVYIDDANIAEDAAAATYGYFWAGVPAAGGARDKLGYLWQYIYKGRIFTYFTDTATYHSIATVAASKTINTDLVFTASVAGIGGNACTVQVTATAVGDTITATVSENTNGGVSIVLDVQTAGGTKTNSDAKTAIDAALAAFTMSTGVLASTLVSCTAGVTVMDLAIAAANFTSGAGGHALTHLQLTGEAIPSAVSALFALQTTDDSDVQLRECNFAHQLATACELASTQWTAVQGAISFKAPEAYGRAQIADWVGALPEFSDNGQEEYIDAPADNGSGILGHKLLVGKSATSDGYRDAEVSGGNSTDSLAWGGIIKTKGASLPNAGDFPYGIDDGDEAIDSNESAVDIGKFVYICGDYAIHSNSYNGGSTYRGDITGTFLGKAVSLDVNVEPIGQQGRVRRVQLGRRIHSTQLDSMAKARIIALRREEGGTELTFTTAKTAAHPDSDYARMSTMRSVNKHLQDIRQICRPYIGKAFNSKSLISIQSSVDQYLQQARVNGYNEGAIAAVSYTRASKILGQLTIKLKMVPPFTIDTITVETTMAADESELS
jgi:hypothetical protein